MDNTAITRLYRCSPLVIVHTTVFITANTVLFVFCKTLDTVTLTQADRPKYETGCWPSSHRELFIPIHQSEPSESCFQTPTLSRELNLSVTHRSLSPELQRVNGSSPPSASGSSGGVKEKERSWKRTVSNSVLKRASYRGRRPFWASLLPGSVYGNVFCKVWDQ